MNMRKTKFVIIFLVLFMVIGYATISVSLSISGKNVVASNLDQFKVYYSDVRINGEHDLRVVKSDKEIVFDFSLSDIGMEKVINYDVTNGSKVFDAQLSISCTGGSEYLSVTNQFDVSVLESLSTRTGTLTLKKLRSNATGDVLSYNVACTISASPIERESIGSGSLLSPVEPIKFNIGDGVSIAGEEFNIISMTNDTVTMLARYNLGTDYRQSKDFNSQLFTIEPDWMDETTSRDLNIQNYDGPVKTYVNEYVSFLKLKTDSNEITGTLITQNELVNLGCVMTNPGYGSCDSSNYVEWIFNNQPWYTRTTYYDDGYSRVIAVTLNQIVDGQVDDPNDGWGIRPVITIPLELARTYAFKQYEVGDNITIADEEFHVIQDHGTMLSVFARYNLGTNLRQTVNPNQVTFANEGSFTWPGIGIVDINIQNYEGNAKTYVNGYVDYLNSQTDNAIIRGDLFKVKKLEMLGCELDNESYSASSIDCSSVFPEQVWLSNGQDWWFGSGFSMGSSDTYYMDDSGEITIDDYAGFHGIRPVVMINKNYFE